jgi:hypothetical protein
MKNINIFTKDKARGEAINIRKICIEKCDRNTREQMCILRIFIVMFNKLGPMSDTFGWEE